MTSYEIEKICERQLRIIGMERRGILSLRDALRCLRKEEENLCDELNISIIPVCEDEYARIILSKTKNPAVIVNKLKQLWNQAEIIEWEE